MTALFLRQFADGPRRLFWLCLACMVLVGWSAAWRLEQGDLLSLLCQPQGDTGARSAAILAMWLAMTLAMMLPSAAPMLATYLDIAEAAREKEIAIVSPIVLAAGYLTVWIAFSLAASALQSTVPPVASPGLASLIFVAAGAYQFSALKQACLRKCRDPMATFLAQWTVRPSGIYRMGLTQGLACLGCCWALMTLAFIAGLMNILWMAGLGVLMLLEKVLPRHGPVVYGLGIGLLAAGVVLFVTG